MALKVIWTPQAIAGLEKVIKYLETYWTPKEILNLEQNIEKFISRIAKYPEIYPSTTAYKNTRKGLVDKNNYIIYRIDKEKKIIALINCRGTKQRPLSST